MIKKIVNASLFTASSIFTIILILYLIAAANNGDIKYITNEDTELQIYRYYGAAGCIYLMKKNGIPVDSEYKSNAEKVISDFISHTDITKLGSTDISKLICIDSVFDFDMKDDLYNELERRYDPVSDLYNEKAYDDYSGLDENTIITMKLASTDEIWKQLDSFGLNDKDDKLIRMVVKGYNNNLSKFDHNDIYSGKWTLSSELENTFYYFLCTDRLDMLNYESMWEVLGKGYVRDLFETNKEESGFVEKSMDNISAILTDNKAHLVLNANINLPYTPQQYYNSLNTPEAFLYNEDNLNDNSYEYTLFSDLCQPDSLKLANNEFFKSSVNSWLKNSYDKFWK